MGAVESVRGAMLGEAPAAYTVTVEAGARVLPTVDSAGSLSVVVSPQADVSAYNSGGPGGAPRALVRATLELSDDDSDADPDE